ncbi:hypothetical protein ACJX0J_030241, partial [Zea mays]
MIKLLNGLIHLHMEAISIYQAYSQIKEILPCISEVKHTISFGGVPMKQAAVGGSIGIWHNTFIKHLCMSQDQADLVYICLCLFFKITMKMNWDQNYLLFIHLNICHRKLQEMYIFLV